MSLTKHPSIIEAAEASGLDLNDPSVEAVLREGVQLGIEQERDRVVSHLELAEKTGATKTALNAIESGATMSQAGRAHIELEARLEDEQLVDEVLENVRLPRSSRTDPAAQEVLDHLRVMVDTKTGAANIEDLDLEVDR